MNTGARVGLAVTAGYLLGRFHKMKWALAVAALASRGRLPGGKGSLLQQGAKILASSSEFTELTDELRGRLIDAGKAAAVAAASNKINSLSDGLRERSDAMRAHGRGDGGGPPASDEDELGEEQYLEEDRAADSRPKRRHAEDDADHVPEQRRAPSRGDSERARPGRQSRTKEDTASRTRASHPSRGSGAQARSGRGSRQGQDSGRARPRATASQKGGDSE